MEQIFTCNHSNKLVISREIMLSVIVCSLRVHIIYRQLHCCIEAISFDFILRRVNDIGQKKQKLAQEKNRYTSVIII